MRNFRHVHGALSLETIEARPIFDGDQIRDLEVEHKNRATDIIEDCMIAANGVTARYLTSRKFPSIRRIVRTPKRWDRIVELAAEHKFSLPAEPDSKALDEFLVKEKAADPLRFPDLSLTVVKLLGAGEYVVDLPGQSTPGHFGLAVRDYTHATAPNRRFPDLLTQRLLKAALVGSPSPYTEDELAELAKVLAPYDALYTSHVRGSSETLLLAAEEVVAVAKAAGVRVQHSHLEAFGKRFWPQVEKTLALHEQARHDDVDHGFDVIPYTAANTTFLAILPPWSLDGGVPKLLERLHRRHLFVDRRLGDEPLSDCPTIEQRACGDERRTRGGH